MRECLIGLANGTHVHCVAALPGWYVVEPEIGESGEFVGVHRAPVVAWLIEFEMSRQEATYPVGKAVTADDIAPKNYEERALQTPDGNFIIPFNAYFSTEEQLIEYFKERRK